MTSREEEVSLLTSAATGVEVRAAAKYSETETQFEALEVLGFRLSVGVGRASGFEEISSVEGDWSSEV